MSGPRIPVSTYRLQFSKDLRFDDARKLVPYLYSLGITDIYASPLLHARRGSAHGYDVADPSHLNPELGTDAEFDALVHELQRHNMGLLLDIVPNHMAASSDNPWWMDVLEDGPRSTFASHFDVDWHPPSRSLENRVLLPILGKPYAQALEARELHLAYAQNGFFLTYFDFTLPIATRSFNRILSYRQDRLERVAGANTPAWQEFQGIQAAVAQIPSPGSAPVEAAGERRQHREGIKERLWSLYSSSPEVKRFIDGNVHLFNGRKGIPATFLLLDQLLADQAYLLAFWRTPNNEINYRRFFTISDLVGLRIEDPMTFEAIHSVALRLATKGMVTGFRVDHIDGLRDPLGYLKRLQERTHPNPASRPRDFYVVVEKILAPGETLPPDWPVHGTTGYDFLNAVNGVFVDTANLEALEDAYSRFIKERIRFSELAYKKKKQVMDTLLSVEMRSLGRYLSVLAAQDRYAREYPRQELTRALIETTACLEPYRTYIRGFEVRPQDKATIAKAVREAQQRNPSIDPSCFRFLRDVLLLQSGPHLLPDQREARLMFVLTWQQFTGPITAKGVEDSALYVYNRLTSLNEVGSSPQSDNFSRASFHDFMQRRHQKWPFDMNATMTHDAKRAEDTRMRINVLSEVPAEWEKRLFAWSRWNESKCQQVKGIRAPEKNEEILLYQTLLGSWAGNDAVCACYIRRIQDFMVKAVREAMVHTRWTVPNLDHERAVTCFVQAILEDSPVNKFLQDFKQFAAKVSRHGALNGLSQLLIKLASPGVADFFQGSELWDLRLVDPDNRTSVDFAQRARFLTAIDTKHNTNQAFPNDWQDDRLKLFVMRQGLRFRKDHASLFLKGAYVPLQVEGEYGECVVTFARRYRGEWVIAVAPRFTTRLASHGPHDWFSAWGKTRVLLPRDAPHNWVDVISGVEAAECSSGEFLVSEMLQNLPVALLASRG